MKNKTALLALAGVLGAIGTVGVAIGIKKIKSQIAEDEILIKEEDLFAAENAECSVDCNEEIADEDEVAPQTGGCGTGCCCAGDNKVYVAEEPTDNVADIEDLKEFGVPDELIEELEKEI
ncbi:MAG: hypothetical protein R3Y09_04435 [Clostridia bacterium]